MRCTHYFMSQHVSLHYFGFIEWLIWLMVLICNFNFITSSQTWSKPKGRRPQTDIAVGINYPDFSSNICLYLNDKWIAFRSPMKWNQVKCWRKSQCLILDTRDEIENVALTFSWLFIKLETTNQSVRDHCRCLKGFSTHDLSVIPVECSANWAMELVILWICNTVDSR